MVYIYKEIYLYIFECANTKKFLVTMTMRVHLFPYRTQKLSTFMLKILASYLAGKISSRQIFYAKINF